MSDTALKKLSLSQLSLYNPARMSDSEIKDSFAARQGVYERIMEDLRGEKPRSRGQHHLIVGQRGMGKSTLLARIAAELRSAPLAKNFIPLVFAEEQYAVDRLSKFWLNCLDSLADACERENQMEAVDRIDERVRKLTANLGTSPEAEEKASSESLAAFLEETKTLKRRAVLFVDNLQLVFERLSSQEQHVLRELLLRAGAPILVGASPSPPAEGQEYGAAFYDHFKPHYLRPLSGEEMKDLMLALAEKVGRSDVRDRVLQYPHRLQVLRQLTGGNPRTTVTLFFLYAEDFAPSVFGDLENLLDRMTPLYKARFEELSEQQQVIASAVANHWDPVTARTVADVTGLKTTSLNGQIDKMQKAGFLEKVELYGQASAGFQVAERFFNVWFLMRSASRRQRREVEFLTRFIESFYESQDRSRLASLMQRERDMSPDRQLFARALQGTLPEDEGRDLKRHAELDALRQNERDARRKLEEVIDFSQLESGVLDFAELREKLVSLVPRGAGVSGEGFAEEVLGSRMMFTSGKREQLASKESLSNEELQSVQDLMKSSWESDISQYGEEEMKWFRNRLSSGQLASLRDLGDWSSAFQKALKEKPSAIEILLQTIPKNLGALLEKELRGQISENLKPNESEQAWVWYNFGFYLHWVLGFHRRAEEAYRESLKRNENFVQAWNGLGNLLKDHLGRYEESEEAYREALKRDENYATPWNGLGNLLQDHLGRYEESEEAYREALKRDENYATPWNGLGNLLQDHLGRYEESEEAYREALKRDENYATPWNGLGNLLQDHLGRYEESEEAYREALKRDENYATPWIGLGNLYCDGLGEFEKAIEAFEEAAELDPEDMSAQNNLLFLKRDFLGEKRVGGFSKEVKEKLLSENPDIVPLHEALFAAYEENWGLTREALVRALGSLQEGLPPYTFDDWMRASAVLFHLGYGEKLLALLKEQGEERRLRPWYEALKAIEVGAKESLLNVAPEVRLTAESYFDHIKKRLDLLPEKTRKWSMPQPKVKGKKRK